MTRTILSFTAIAILGLLLVACGTAAADPPASSISVEAPSQADQIEEASDAEPTEEPTPTGKEQVVDINPFEDGLGGGNTDEFPFPATDDAFDFGNVMGLYSFTTHFDMDGLIELYSAAIPTLGYLLNSDTVIPEMAILSYEGDGEALTLNISTNEDGSNTVSILIGTIQ